MVLERIIERKRSEVQQRKQERPLGQFQSQLTSSDRSLERALKRSHHGYICECKRASPSRGRIAPGLSVEQVAEAYRPFADGISVLTDTVDFGGSFADLRRMRECLPQPVLCKDFVVDPYQVYEARSHGADAVLLMLSVLSDDAFRDCFRVAESLALDALVEIHSEAEMQRALDLEARLFGINNRNLKTLAIDLGTTERLAQRIPESGVRIGESGLLTHADVRRLRPHVDAFLVGTALLLDGEPEKSLRDLVFGRVKVCGLTDANHAVKAYELGARFGGLIFAPRSPRCVSLERAEALAQAALLDWVGVFVNASLDDIREAAVRCSLAAVQLHGEETADFVEALREQLPAGCEVWKAVSGRGVTASEVNDWFSRVDKVVLDSGSASQRGGTGQTFDWSVLEAIGDRSRVILAGGISPENAPEASAFGCFALDVNSQVEAAPGQKDIEKMTRLFAGLRG